MLTLCLQETILFYLLDCFFTLLVFVKQKYNLINLKYTVFLQNKIFNICKSFIKVSSKIYLYVLPVGALQIKFNDKQSITQFLLLI